MFLARCRDISFEGALQKEIMPASWPEIKNSYNTLRNSLLFTPFYFLTLSLSASSSLS